MGYVFWGLALVLGRVAVDPEPDPITALLSRDWAAVGGWSLFLGLAMLIVIGAFREVWVPGARLRRVEALLDQANELVKQLTAQNGKLLEANELTKYVISQVAPIPRPKRRSTVAESDEGGPQ